MFVALDCVQVSEDIICREIYFDFKTTRIQTCSSSLICASRVQELNKEHSASMMLYCWYTVLWDCGSQHRINMFFRHISPQTAFCSVQCERLQLGEDLVSEERVCLRFSAVNVFLSSVYRLRYDALATSSPPTSHTQSHGMMQMHR